MRDYNAYLFDMDGTICRSFDPWLQIVQSTLKEYDIAADKKVIAKKVFGNAGVGLVELGVPSEDLVKVFDEWDKKAKNLMLAVELYEDINAVLKRLKQNNKKLALITATARPTTEVVLNAHGLHGIFDLILAGGELPAQKPEPDALLLALKELDITPESAIMLGDSEKDIQAANNAGLDSMLFFPEAHNIYHDYDELRKDKPTYIIHTWKELLDQIQ